MKFKTYSLKSFLIALFFMTMSTSYAQDASLLDNFSAFEYNGSIYLNWTVSAGTTCNGIDVYRSGDNASFNHIGRIPGVCGSNSSPVSYSFTDENPIPNNTNYYRLELGNFGYSTTISHVFISIQNNEFQIRPHPVTSSSESKIYFNNSTKKEYEFILYNLIGVKHLRLTTTENFFPLSKDFISSGIYVFTIAPVGSQPKITGRLILN